MIPELFSATSFVYEKTVAIINHYVKVAWNNVVQQPYHIPVSKLN